MAHRSAGHEKIREEAGTQGEHSSQSVSALILTQSASIPILLGRGLCCRLGSYMGVLTHYTRLQSWKWWYRWSNLAGAGGLLLHVLRHVVYG